MQGLKRIGALWLQHATNGKKYLSGKFNASDTTTLKIVVFHNDFAEKPTDPDFVIYLKEADTASPPPRADEFLDDMPFGKQAPSPVGRT